MKGIVENYTDKFVEAIRTITTALNNQDAKNSG